MAVWVALAALVSGCRRSGVREAPITGKPADPPVGMPVQWQAGQRYLYRLDVSAGSMVPRRTTGKLINAETTLGMDLAFAVTNAATGDNRWVEMAVLALQMETSHDGGVAMTFDSGNRAIFVEDNPLVTRLQRLVGLRLRYQLSPENKVTRVDGLKDLADRMSAGGNSVRGVAADVLRRFFNQQFFRDVIEMGMFPKEPVKIGQTWKETRQGTPGLWGTGAPLELTYKFRGWQRRDGTNCARLEFAGTFKPPGGPPPAGPPPGVSTNQGPGRPANVRAGAQSTEEGSLTGQTWYNPELAIGVEMAYDQSITKRASAAPRMAAVRRAAVRGGTNQAGRVDVTLDPNARPPNGPPPNESPANAPPPDGSPANAPPPNGPPPRAPGPNGPPPTFVMAPGTNTMGTNVPPATTSHWYVSLKLLEVEAAQPQVQTEKEPEAGK